MIKDKYLLKVLLKALIMKSTLPELNSMVDGNFINHKKRVGELATPQLNTIYGSTIEYKTSSATGSGTWTQKFKIIDVNELIKDKGISLEEAVDYALEDADVHCSCDCPAFKWWGYKYINTILGTIYGRGNSKRPDVRNPNERGIFCKHLDKAAKQLFRDKKKLVDMFGRKRKLMYKAIKNSK